MGLIHVYAGFVLLVLLLKRPRLQSPDLAHSITLMQQHIEGFRSDVHASIQHVTENVNRQLGAVTQQLQSQTGAIGNRLDSATRVIGDVQRNLGELGKAAEEIKQLGLNVSKLDELLRAPKLRGGLGEFLLEDLLKQVLPAEHVVMQYRFRNGFTVDAVVRTSDHMVPIDSKFPLENFRKMIHAPTDAEKKTFQRAFVSDVRKHIDAIAEKYILPDEGTFPFALMYIPAENIYYEVIIKDEPAQDAEIYRYALERKVVPVSPNSIYAFLQVISLGLRGMSIERSARQILNTLTRLQDDFVTVRETFATMGNHLDNARKKYDEADKRLSNIETKFEQIAEQSLPETQPRPVRDENVLMPS